MGHFEEVMKQHNLKKEKENELRYKLSKNIREQMDELRSLHDMINGQHAYEDRMYRFYHHSFKVYDLQEYTLQMVTAFEKLLPGEALNEDFMKIVALGTGKEFTLKVNENWVEETVWITNAFLHARYFLDMIMKLIESISDEGKGYLTFPQASTLYLYNLR